jgi:ribosomal protein S12 methylthiotransferase accessory factor
MADADLTTTYVNTNQELFPHRMSEEEGKAIEDLLSLYFPNGPVQKSNAYHGGTGISQVLSTNNAFYDINHVLKQMLGVPSLDTGLEESLVAGGKGFRIPDSFLSAMGESIERFAGTMKVFQTETELQYGSYRTLTNRGLNCLSPAELPLFAEEQYEEPQFLFNRFEEDTHLGWVRAEQLISGNEVWVPAQIAMFFYVPTDDEEQIAYSSSAGLATHVDTPRAIYGGITEVIERDAMMASWYCGIPPKRIRIDQKFSDPQMQRRTEELWAQGEEIRCYSHALDMPDIPIISTIEQVPYLKKFSYYAGGACSIDAEDALLHSLVEYGQAEAQLKLATYAPDRGWAIGADMYFDIPEDKPTEEMNTFLEHLGYYGYDSNAERLEWFLEEGGEVNLSDLPTRDYNSSQERLDLLLDALDGHGIDPIVIDYTLPQMKQLKVWKTIIPDLVQPHISANPYLGHPRLRRLPMKVGMREEPLDYDEHVDGPVPFP